MINLVLGSVCYGGTIFFSAWSLWRMPPMWRATFVALTILYTGVGTMLFAEVLR